MPPPLRAWATTWNRYISDLTGGLAVGVDNTGTATLQLANLHGDIIATTTLGQAGITNYTHTDEYGQPDTTTTGRYGWLGTHQRDTNTLGGLTLMGARLYAPTTDRFLTIDPIPGGNDNRYTYPADPINMSDMDGECAAVLGLLAIPGIGEVLLAVALVVVVVYAIDAISRASRNARTAERSATSSKSKSQEKKDATKYKSKKEGDTRKYYKRKKGAIKSAKQHAKRTDGSYRGPCSSNDHCHVDYFNRAGQTKRTVHFYWRIR